MLSLYLFNRWRNWGLKRQSHLSKVSSEAREQGLDTSLNYPNVLEATPGGSEGNEPAFNTEDLGSIPGSRRSPGEGHGNLLQYSCLENSMDREVWQATVHGVAKSWTQLSTHFFLTYFFAKLLITCTIYIWIPLLPLFYFYKSGIVHITNFS